MKTRAAGEPTIRGRGRRTKGPLTTDRFVYGTASYAIANEVLRSDEFRAGQTVPVSTGIRWLVRHTTSPESAHPPWLLPIKGSGDMRMHKLAGHAFTPQATAALAIRVHNIAHQLLDEIANERGNFDLVTRYASRLPVTVATVNLIGNAIPLLLSHRDQLERLKAEPDGWPNAVEEILRYDSPVQMAVRLATAETAVAGTYIRKDSQIVIMIGSANRDPDRFPDPDTFDTTRENARDHLAFSAGMHYCLGAQLARLEGAAALRALFERFPGLALDGAPTRHMTKVQRGYKHLPVTASAHALSAAL